MLERPRERLALGLGRASAARAAASALSASSRARRPRARPARRRQRRFGLGQRAGAPARARSRGRSIAAFAGRAVAELRELLASRSPLGRDALACAAPPPARPRRRGARRASPPRGRAARQARPRPRATLASAGSVRRDRARRRLGIGQPLARSPPLLVRASIALGGIVAAAPPRARSRPSSWPAGRARRAGGRPCRARPARRQLMRERAARVARRGAASRRSASSAAAWSCSACCAPASRLLRSTATRRRASASSAARRRLGRPRPSARRSAAPRRGGSCRSERGSARRRAPGASAPRPLLLVGEHFVEPRRLASVARSFCSASLRRACRPEMPAASSSISRRSTGLAAMTAPILPWLTSAGECAPVAASANSRATSFCADVAAVDPIGRAGAALDPPGDLALASRPSAVAAVALDQQRDFGEVARPGGSRCRRRSRRPSRRRAATWASPRPSPSGSLRAGWTCRSRWGRRPRSAPARSAARPARRSS